MGSDLYGEHESTSEEASTAYARCAYYIKKLLEDVKDRELTYEERLILNAIKFTGQNLQPT